MRAKDLFSQTVSICNELTKVQFIVRSPTAVFIAFERSDSRVVGPQLSKSSY